MIVTGRPTDYSEDIAAHICSEIAAGRSLRSICGADEMPDKSTVFRWLSKHEAFRDQYVRAQEDRTAAMAEDLLEIADQYDSVQDKLDVDHIQRAKLRIDTRKWLMSKMAPKRYGDKTDHTLSNPDGTPITFQTIFEPKPDK